MAEITRDRLAEVLDEVALLLELKGENPFKVRAYRHGAEVVRSFEGDIVQRAVEGNLGDIKGLGEALRKKLGELAATGRLGYHDDLRASFPESLFGLLDLQGLGPRKVKILFESLGVDSVEALRAACESGRVASLPGFGVKSSDRILAAIASREQFAGRFLLVECAPVAEHVLAHLRRHPDTVRAEVAGSCRRARETVHDLDFLVATREPASLTAHFTALPEVAEIMAHGDTKASVRLENGLQCDLRAVSNTQWPFALMYFTGSKEHNVQLRQRAGKAGLTLNEYQLAPAAKAGPSAPLPEITGEDDIYRALGLDFVVPELREGRGELDAAEEGALPRLVEQDNLRGTFHCHTTASDGRSSLEEMAAAAHDLGLGYLGIADHSKSSFQARGLDEERLAAQIAEIRALDTAYDDLRLFAGSEVDILKDGSLDFDDAVLAGLDYCVASIHASFNLREREMTRRVVRAMENPHVTMLGHLTGRLLLRRDPYPVDHEVVIDCAAETGTVIELNCSAMRMDMDWRWWRRARDRGVRCAINPDAHHVRQLQLLHFGVRMARKGWLRREDIVNCLPLPEMEAWLRAPKPRRNAP